MWFCAMCNVENKCFKTVQIDNVTYWFEKSSSCCLRMSQSDESEHGSGVFNYWLLLYNHKLNKHSISPQSRSLNQTSHVQMQSQKPIDNPYVITLDDSDNETNSPPRKRAKQQQDTELEHNLQGLKMKEMQSQSLQTQAETFFESAQKIDADFEFENLLQLSETQVTELCVKTGETISEKALIDLLDTLKQSEVENPFLNVINKHIVVPKFLTYSKSRSFDMILRQYIERFPAVSIQTFFVPVITNNEFSKNHCDILLPWIKCCYSQEQKTTLFRTLLQNNISLKTGATLSIIHMLVDTSPLSLSSLQTELISNLVQTCENQDDEVAYGKLITLVTQKLMSIDVESKQKLQFLIKNIKKSLIKKSAEIAFNNNKNL